MSFQMLPCPHCPAESGRKYRCVTCDAESMACMDWLRHDDEEHSDEVVEQAS